MAEFDPTEHTVEEVKAHLADNPDDYDRVMELEKAGQNRVTITELSAPEQGETSDAPHDADAERAAARAHVMRDPQYVMAEAAKRLNQGEGQEPFQRQDDEDTED